MKRLIIITFCSFCLLNSHASPQSPDYIVIGKDTIGIYFLPLNQLDSIKIKEFYKNLNSCKEDMGFSFNLWRDYQAIWQVVDNKLYLIGLKGNRNSDKILKSTFPENYENGKVLAYWFSSFIAIPKGKLLKWDGIFSRTYYKEEIFEFRDGFLINRKIVDNYTDLRNGISRLNRKKITDKIFKKIKKLNWKELSKCDCDDKYIITIDENGKISEIEMAPIFDTEKENIEYAEDHKNCITKFKEQLKEMQFDIIRWNGKPFSEKIIFEIFYDKKLENWTE